MMSKLFLLSLCAALYSIPVCSVENEMKTVERSKVEMTDEIEFVNGEEEVDFDTSLAGIAEDEFDELLLEDEFDLEAMTTKEQYECDPETMMQNHQKSVS